MFTTGQWIFAACFLVTFIILMIYTYRKDLQMHRVFYKGNYKILLGFILFIALLFVIKFTMKR